MTSTLYPIGAVARLTGLTVEALRAWERRYSIVQPVRDERGRMYTEDDVQRLKLLRNLTERGHPIGRLAALSVTQLEELSGAVPLDALEPESSAPAIDLDALMAHLRGFRISVVERRLVDLALMLTPRQLVMRVVLPVMQRVGEEWCAGRLTIAEEHLISKIVEGLLTSVIRQHTDSAAPVRLVFAHLSGERHSIGLQCAALLAAGARFGVVNLGLELPASEIAATALRVTAAAIVLGAVHDPTSRSTAREVRALAAALPTGVSIWLGGPPLEHLKLDDHGARVIPVPDLPAFERQLARHKALDRLF